MGHAVECGGSGLDWQPIDLLLGQGTAEELAAMRSAVAADPMLAIAVAETVGVLEQLRQVRVEPGPLAAARFMDVVLRAERRLVPAPRTTWRTWLWAAAASLLTFAVLAWVDPLRLRQPRRGQGASPTPIAQRPAPAADAATMVVQAEVARTPAEIEMSESLAAMRKRLELESAERLTAALDAALQPSTDALVGWLHPRNALAVLRLDHELRTIPEVRLRAMRGGGGIAFADDRAQELADAIAAELRDWLPVRPPLRAPELTDVSLAVRALIAAGAASPGRAQALRLGADWLADILPACSGDALVSALAGLVESAAVTGEHVEAVAVGGQRLVDEVLRADTETWRRRRPDLLTARTPTSKLGEAGRMLSLLPGFGLAADRCAIVRQLLLGQVRERVDAEDGPDVLAALVFGFADLLDDVEHDGAVRQLRRWKPALLAPDFTTVLQIAWGVEPGRIGFTRLQRDLRQLAVLPAPAELGRRASLCMSLASNYAAPRDGSLLRYATGE